MGHLLAPSAGACKDEFCTSLKRWSKLWAPVAILGDFQHP